MLQLDISSSQKLVALSMSQTSSTSPPLLPSPRSSQSSSITMPSSTPTSPTFSSTGARSPSSSSSSSSTTSMSSSLHLSPSLSQRRDNCPKHISMPTTSSNLSEPPEADHQPSPLVLQQRGGGTLLECTSPLDARLYWLAGFRVVEGGSGKSVGGQGVGLG